MTKLLARNRRAIAERYLSGEAIPLLAKELNMSGTRLRAIIRKQTGKNLAQLNVLGLVLNGVERHQGRTDGQAYSGADSGCERATAKLGSPSHCISCPLESCLLEDGDREREKND